MTIDVAKIDDHPGVATEGEPDHCLNCGTKLNAHKETVIRDGKHAVAPVAHCPTCHLQHIGPTVDKAGDLVDVAKEHLGWDKMVSHLKGEGHSQESAERIAGYIAGRKYGPGMNRDKSLGDTLDVLKTIAGQHGCPGCGSTQMHNLFHPGGGSALHATCSTCGQKGWVHGTGLGHSLLPSFHAPGVGKMPESKPLKAAPPLKVPVGGGVAKNVDATEQNLLGSPGWRVEHDPTGHTPAPFRRHSCPQCGHGFTVREGEQMLAHKRRLQVGQAEDPDATHKTFVKKAKELRKTMPW